jgi:UDP-N-acetylglucosamine 2-epimerase (non-hydrolysing)
MKIMMIVGARPNFMKAAPILAAIAAHNQKLTKTATGEKLVCTLVHTGQHYDARMSDAFFSDLQMPHPDVFLGAGSGSHAVQTAEIMKRFEEVVLRERPDLVVVVGDVNSTLACALVTAKIALPAGQARPLIAHVEAGLRSFDRGMPEEINRVLTDHLCDLLFVTEESGLRNLEREGIPQERVFFVGNTMIDSLLTYKDQADASPVLDRLGLRAPGPNGKPQVRPYALLTLHRPANVDDPATFQEILAGLDELVGSHPVVFPAHPRTQKQIEHCGLQSYFVGDAKADERQTSPAPSTGILMTGPKGYLDFLCLMKHARLVVTDSGGIQEETTCLGVPCVTVRENTERPVTVECGTNVLAGVRQNGIRESIRRQLEARPGQQAPYLWDGRAAQRIVEILARPLAAADGVPEKILPAAILR